MAGAGGTWAVALSDDGQYLAGVTQDGHIKVWDLNANGELIRDYETKGSFGTCLDMVSSTCRPLSRNAHASSAVCGWPPYCQRT
jgi:WD40 repeat protein